MKYYMIKKMLWKLIKTSAKRIDIPALLVHLFPNNQIFYSIFLLINVVKHEQSLHFYVVNPFIDFLLLSFLEWRTSFIHDSIIYNEVQENKIYFTFNLGIFVGFQKDNLFKKCGAKDMNANILWIRNTPNIFFSTNIFI